MLDRRDFALGPGLSRGVIELSRYRVKLELDLSKKRMFCPWPWPT